MKSFLRLTSLAIISIIAFSSCTKTEIITSVQSPIAGSWRLSAAAEGDSYGWSPFSTGLENGIFTMYDDGTALYDESNVSMQGSWYVSTVNGAYFDEYGNYYNGAHQALQLHLSDSYSHSSIDLNFDNVSFYNGHFTATYFNGDYIERYTFSRY